MIKYFECLLHSSKRYIFADCDVTFPFLSQHVAERTNTSVVFFYLKTMSAAVAYNEIHISLYQVLSHKLYSSGNIFQFRKLWEIKMCNFLKLHLRKIAYC